jgi:hypothetical protein
VPLSSLLDMPVAFQDGLAYCQLQLPDIFRLCPDRWQSHSLLYWRRFASLPAPVFCCHTAILGLAVADMLSH